MSHSQAKMKLPCGETKLAKTEALICKRRCLNVEQCPGTELLISPRHSGAGRLGVEGGEQPLLWLLTRRSEEHHNTCWKSSGGTKPCVLCYSGAARMRRGEALKIPVSGHPLYDQQGRNLRSKLGPVVCPTFSVLSARAWLRWEFPQEATKGLQREQRALASPQTYERAG